MQFANLSFTTHKSKIFSRECRESRIKTRLGRGNFRICRTDRGSRAQPPNSLNRGLVNPTVSQFRSVEISRKRIFPATGREKVGRVRLELVQLRHKPCLGAASASRALMYFIYARIKGIAALERHGETQDVSQRTSCSSSSFLSSLLVASRGIMATNGEEEERGGAGWLLEPTEIRNGRLLL